MEAHAESLKFLKQDPKELIIPFFQRGYVWEKSNWNELFQSLYSESDDTYLGSIIIKHIKGRNPTKANVIDGQQRLTTISLLFKAIYDTLSIEHNISVDDKRSKYSIGGILNFLFYTIYEGDNFFDNAKIRIQQSIFEKEIYDTIIKENVLITGDKIKVINHLNEIDIEAKDDNTSLILKCYKFFRDQLAQETPDDIMKIYNRIADSSNKYLVLIEMEADERNEQAIFDTINRAGVRLSISDIIKNNIFKRMMECMEEADDKDVENQLKVLYKEKWSDPFYCKDDDGRNIWDEKKPFGNNQRTNLDFLLYCVATVNWGQYENMFDELANVYKNKADCMDKDKLGQLIQQIFEYSNVYKNYILNVQDNLKTMDFEYDNYINRLLLVLETIEVKMFHPYVLKKLVEYETKLDDDDFNEKLKEEFKVLESFVLRRRISTRGTHDYTDKCAKILEEGKVSLLVNELIEKDGKIADTDMAGYLKVIQQNNAKVILFIIELCRNQNPSNATTYYKYIYELEHIMPRKWEKNWSNVVLAKEDGTVWKNENGDDVDISSDEGKGIRNCYVNSLGNMTLLQKKLNATISNGTFSDKIEGDGKKRDGIRKYGQLKITQEILKDYDAGKKEWNEVSIEKRRCDLQKEFLKLWPSNFDDKLLK